MDSSRKFKIYKDLQMLHTVLEGLCVLKKINDIVYKKQKRSCSVRRINRDRKRNGFFAVTFQKIKEMDNAQFFIYTRMDRELYYELLTLIAPLLVKTSMKKPISPECPLAVLLLYLSQGNSLQTSAWSFKLRKETVRQIILQTSEVLWRALHPIYVSETNSEYYKEICNDFWELWNLPNCVGSIDGKHIAIRCPPNSGSQFFSYKKHFSIVLMAVCDAKYYFTSVDIGAYGSEGDGGIFHISRSGKRLLENKLPIPETRNLPNTTQLVPCYFVADAAFPLSSNLMGPYSGTLLPPKEEHFNKSLSRARRTIENSFGILVSRWRILLTTLHMLPENAEKIVLASIALHNFIMLNKRNAASYFPSKYTDWEDSDGQVHDGLWRSEVGTTHLLIHTNILTKHQQECETKFAITFIIIDNMF